MNKRADNALAYALSGTHVHTDRCFAHKTIIRKHGAKRKQGISERTLEAGRRQWMKRPESNSLMVELKAMQSQVEK